MDTIQEATAGNDTMAAPVPTKTDRPAPEVTRAPRGGDGALTISTTPPAAITIGPHGPERTTI